VTKRAQTKLSSCQLALQPDMAALAAPAALAALNRLYDERAPSSGLPRR
jgi:hypothetical protein